MDIYIKPVKKVFLTEKKAVFIKDITEVLATRDVADAVNEIKLLDIHESKKHDYLISVSDVVKAIKKSYPDYSVVNLGEMDTLVEYSAVKPKENKAFKWLKIVAICLILLTGSATAIMSFYSDAQISDAFKQYYKIFTGKESDKPLIIEIPYSFGIAAGIIVFFNHFIGKKVTEDPTPIEVEMSKYDTEVSDTIIGVLSAERARREERTET